jgi:hypothetical protein
MMGIVPNNNIGSLIRREGLVTFFALVGFLGAQEGFAVLKHQKVTKKCFQQRGFFAHNAFALQIGQNHGLQNLALLSRPACPSLLQVLLCPSRPQSHHVLPVFARSCSAYLLSELEF